MMIEREKDSPHAAMPQSLNPYSNGMIIELACLLMVLAAVGLNPYSNGMIIELLFDFFYMFMYFFVLILILME